jgi:hypothetical protein
MSVSILMETAVVVMLAVGGSTEDALRMDAWENAGICSGRHCYWLEGMPECQDQLALRRPCKANMLRIRLPAQ